MAGRVLTEASLRASLTLPRTTLPLRAGAKLREPRLVPRLTSDLYRRQLQQAERADPPFVLHDGPPYANGGLHMGHFLNKVLKDIINRHALLSGRRVRYVPGWDCHGLPIELKALQSQLTSGLSSTPTQSSGGNTSAAAAAKTDLSPAEIRLRARECAEGAIAEQLKDFVRWGIMADWDVSARQRRGNAYVTMDAAYEAAQLGVFEKLVAGGFVHRDLKPVYWSPSSATALAEAELEYVDDHRSTAAYVAFPLHSTQAMQNQQLAQKLQSIGDVAAVAWTTTPWTLPANVALAVHPDMLYCVVRAGAAPQPSATTTAGGAPASAAALSTPTSSPSSLDSRHFIVASERISALEAVLSGYKLQVVIADIRGAALIGCRFSHPMPAGALAPIMSLESSATSSATSNSVDHHASRVSSRTSIVIPADYVTGGSGTGIVHTAPGHGHDDFGSCKDWNARHQAPAGDGRGGSSSLQLPELPIICPIDNHGNFTAEVGPLLQGKHILTDGNAACIQLLREGGHLLATEKLKHRYPYDWRTKQPVIIRATQQWFVRIGSLIPECAAGIEQIRMVPAVSKHRLSSMLGSRTEWCISRQRSWGVPIPALYVDAPGQPNDGEAYMTPQSIEHIRGIIREKGADAWWTMDAHEFLPAEVRADAERKGMRYRKGFDTLDVWFDSGTSWAAAWAHDNDGSTSSSGDGNSVNCGSNAAGVVSDMVLEGSDQHRGWFQSSLITAMAAFKQPPYKAIVTHGFVLDEQMRKMSKSLGNVIAPGDIIDGVAATSRAAAAPVAKGGDIKSKTSAGKNEAGKKQAASSSSASGSPSSFTEGQGVDVLRYWVASSDYSGDISVGPSVISFTGDALRKVRHTLRFILSALHDFDPVAAHRVLSGSGVSSGGTNAVESDKVLAAWRLPPSPLLFNDPHASAQQQRHRIGLLDRAMLHRLAAFEAEVRAHYSSLQFAHVVAALNNFTSVELSSSYFDFCKDRLYCDSNVLRSGTEHNAAGASMLLSQQLPRKLVIQSILWECLRSVTRALAPIAVFTAEDVYQHSAAFLLNKSEIDAAVASASAAAASVGVAPNPSPTPSPSKKQKTDDADPAADVIYTPSTIFDSEWTELPSQWQDKEAASAWACLASLRTEMNGVLELARKNKDVGSPSDTCVELHILGTGTADGLPAASAAAPSALSRYLEQLYWDNQLTDFLLSSQALIVTEARNPSSPSITSSTVPAPASASHQQHQSSLTPAAKTSAAGEPYRYEAVVSIPLPQASSEQQQQQPHDQQFVRIVVRPADGSKCARCRLHRPEVELHHAKVCHRCDDAIAVQVAESAAASAA